VHAHLPSSVVTQKNAKALYRKKIVAARIKVGHLHKRILEAVENTFSKRNFIMSCTWLLHSSIHFFGVITDAFLNYKPLRLNHGEPDLS
jgi:hypothetical protein